MVQLNEKIKKIRAKEDMSLEQLAERCALTTQQLALIENGGVVPTIAIIVKICRALNIPMSTLLDGTEESALSVTRSGERPEVVNFSVSHNMPKTNLDFFSMAPTKYNRTMEPFMIEVNRDMPAHDSSHEGEEFIYVIEGKINLQMGQNSTILKEGDSAYYDSLVPHTITSINEKSKILAVIYTPW